MGSKPLRTKRKSASIESCLRPLGATIDMATPDMWTSNRLWEGGIVALIFTKRQLKGRGGYWVVSLSGNCCLGIEPAIEIEIRTFQHQPCELGHTLQSLQTFRQQDRICFIDRRHREGS